MPPLPPVPAQARPSARPRSRRRVHGRLGGVFAVLLVTTAGCALPTSLNAPSASSSHSSGTSTASAPGNGATQPTSMTPAGCSEASPAGLARQPGQPRALPSPTAARANLATLRIAERSSGDDYCRAAFGPGEWLDLDHNGCNARQDTLKRLALTVRTGLIRSHGSTCEEVLAGQWRDAYTGNVLAAENMKDPQQAATIQIDHVVSLFNAWVSGAASWEPKRRVQFAHDLSVPELVAVAGSINFTKSYRGPESWRPATPYQCDFARSVVEVKRAYDLSVTPAEAAALNDMLGRCAPTP